MKKLALGLTATAALLPISAATAITAPASAAPIIIRDTVTSPIFETGVPHDCRDLTGTIVGTDIVSFQSVETDQASTSRARPRTQRASTGAMGRSRAHTDSGDFFTAAGVFEFSNTFREINHFTISDGVVRVDLQKGHFHFFGDC